MNRRGFLAILAGAPIVAKMETPLSNYSFIQIPDIFQKVAPLTATEAMNHQFDALRYMLVDQVHQKIVPVSERWMEELNRGTFD